jgi:hypothetical protein
MQGPLGRLRNPHGAPADLIQMPDSSPEARERVSVQVGSLTLRPSDGFSARMAVVITEDGATLSGSAALWAVYLELRKAQEADEF